MIRPFFELLNGTAFRPDAINTEIRMSDRFFGRTVLAVSIRKNEILTAAVKFGRTGAPIIGKPSSIPFAPTDGADAIKAFIEKQAKAAKTEDVLLVGGQRWIANLIELSFQGADKERNRLLLEEPVKVIGERLLSGNVAAVVAHPTSNRSLKLTFTRGDLIADANLVSEAGLRLIRLHYGCYSLLRYIVEELPKTVAGKEILIIDGSSALMILNNDGDWDDVGFSAEIGGSSDAQEKVKELLSRRADTTKPLVFVSAIEFDFAAAGLVGDKVERLLGDQPLVEFYCACSEGKDHVAFDFNLESGNPRQHLAASRRSLVFLGLSLSFGGAAGAGYINYSMAREIDSTNRLNIESNEIIAQRGKITETIARVESDRAKAELLGKWITLGVSVQPIIVSTVEAAEIGLTLDEFSLKTWDGAPQMEVRFIARGELRRCGAYIDRVSTNLGQAGFMLSNPDQTPAPGGGAIIFIGRYNYPSPNKVSWKKPEEKVSK